MSADVGERVQETLLLNTNVCVCVETNNFLSHMVKNKMRNCTLTPGVRNHRSQMSNLVAVSGRAALFQHTMKRGTWLRSSKLTVEKEDTFSV